MKRSLLKAIRPYMKRIQIKQSILHSLWAYMIWSFLIRPPFQIRKPWVSVRGIFNVIMRSCLRKCHVWLMQVVRFYFREICAHSSSMRKRFLLWVYRCKILLRKLFQKTFRVIHVFISAIYLLKSKLLLQKYTSFYV